jgi:hypothetical protein
MRHIAPTGTEGGSMTVEEFRRALKERGGAAELWVVFVEDGLETTMGKGFRLDGQAAFWTRGDAYSYAFTRNERTVWRHFYVFHVRADGLWAWSEGARELRFETVFMRAKDVPAVCLTPAELAALVEKPGDAA